jgi:hypothetical protein
MDHDGGVNDFLVVYLDSIDEQLLEYLDEDEELKLDAVQRLRFYTTALLDGSIHQGQSTRRPRLGTRAPTFAHVAPKGLGYEKGQRGGWVPAGRRTGRLEES